MEEQPSKKQRTTGNVEVTVIDLAGEVLAKRSIPPGCTVGDLKEALAESLGFPSQDLRLLEGQEEPGNGVAFRMPPAERLLSCVFLAPPPASPRTFRKALRRGQHGFLRGMLAVADAQERRSLLLHGDSGGALASALALKYNSLESLNVLVKAAADEGLLEECLLGGEAWPLSTAAAQCPEQVRLLLSAAAQCQGLRHRLLCATDDQGCTALHCAAAEAQLEVVEVLIAAARKEGLLGALLAEGDAEGCTPLHFAARSGSAALLRSLLTAAAGEGGDFVARLLAAPDVDGRTPWHLVASAGDAELLQALGEAAAS